MNTVENVVEALVELDQRVDFAEGEGIRQRWLFGQELLLQRVGKLLPAGLLDELEQKTGKDRSELQFRMRFAQRFPTEDELCNAVTQYKSWHQICNYGLTGKSPRTTSTGEVEWYTPGPYIEAARKVLGAIDTDPASNSIAQETIQAAQYFTKETDGLEHEWHGSVWMNPPFTMNFEFIEKLLHELESGRVTQAIVLTHNFTDTAWFHMAEELARCICFTRGRINFLTPEGEKDGTPANGQTFFYFGDDESAFRSWFSEFGFIR